MQKPVIKSYADLTPADFEASPVWINCHVADEAEDWYDETVEDDYRPAGRRPSFVNDDNMYVVKATATLSDGTRLPAFLNLIPMFDGPDAVDAGVFTPDGRGVDMDPSTSGWGRGIRKRKLDALGRPARAIFPMRVAPDDPALPVVTVVDWFAKRIEWPAGDRPTFNTAVRHRIRGRVLTLVPRWLRNRHFSAF